MPEHPSIIDAIRPGRAIGFGGKLSRHESRSHSDFVDEQRRRVAMGNDTNDRYHLTQTDSA
jgi:hypothetical protein